MDGGGERRGQGTAGQVGSDALDSAKNVAARSRIGPKPRSGRRSRKRVCRPAPSLTRHAIWAKASGRGPRAR